MKYILSVIFVLLMGLLLSCSGGGPTGSKGNVIWPLSVGSEWQGTMTYYDTDSNIVEQSSMTFYISGDTTIAGDTWYFFGAYTDEPPKVGVSYWLLSNQNDGLRQIFLPIFFREPEGELPQQLWMKYPTKPGDGYWVGDYDSITVTSTDRIVYAPQGTRRCIVYDYYRDAGAYRRYYVAPGIGVVRWEELDLYDFAPGSDPPQTPGWVWELERLVTK